jgi:hypothetical protein
LSLAVVTRNAFSEGGKLSFETGTAQLEAGHACPRDTEDEIMVALGAHGYGSVSEHPEQIFTDIVMTEESRTESRRQAETMRRFRPICAYGNPAAGSAAGRAMVSGRLRRPREIAFACLQSGSHESQSNQRSC